MFLLSLEFDGTDFCGWQRQSDGRSVQLVMEEALSRLAGSPRVVIGAGRTDAGVHALAMPVSVKMPARWTAPDLLRSINATLPGDTAVKEVRAVRAGTDARRSALSRRYWYDIGIDGTSRSPFASRMLWPLGRALNLPAMESATTLLLGEHSFQAFAIVGEPKPHYLCTISQAHWEILDASRIRFHIQANRFLHRMVRLIVGTLVEIGLGRRGVEDMAQLLLLTHNGETSSPAPAAGLSFVSASYPEDCFLDERASW